MTMSFYPQGVLTGISLRGVPILQTHPGTVFWVDNGLLPGGGPSNQATRCTAGSDGNPGTFNKPLATLAQALALSQQTNGDIIMLKCGHAETISSATALALNVAGVAIIGLGIGASRPTITLDTATTATIAVQAANVSIQNVLFQANFANIASFFTAQSMSITASIATDPASSLPTMTVTAVGSGVVRPGQALLGTGVKPGTIVLSQVTGATGGIGTYLVSLAQTVASTTITASVTDFTIELCEFRDITAVLNALAVFTAPATANAADGFRFAKNRVKSLGTTAATTAIIFGAGADRVQIEDNFGVSAVVNNTAAVFAGGAFQFTALSILRNMWERPNTTSVGGSFVSGSGNAWTGMAADNYFAQANAATGLWIATGHGTAFGLARNFSNIAQAAGDTQAVINPAEA